MTASTYDLVRSLKPAHPDLANAAGVPAELANERYVEALAYIVYYWGYPAIDTFGRTSAWEVMKNAGPGATMGLFPGAPKSYDELAHGIGVGNFGRMGTALQPTFS